MERQELAAVVWALVLVQGAITLVSFVEAALVGAGQGLVLAPILALTGGGAALAFASARGLRRGRRWARRVTLVAESLVLVAGTLSAVATLALAHRLSLVSVLTTVIAPVAVIVLLRRIKRNTALVEAAP